MSSRPKRESLLGKSVNRRRAIGLSVLLGALILGVWFGGAPFQEKEADGTQAYRLSSQETLSGAVAGLEDTQVDSAARAEDLDSSEIDPSALSAEDIDALDEWAEEEALGLDELPPQILEDLRRIAEAKTPSGVDPEVLRELEWQLGLNNRFSADVAEVVIKSMVARQIAYEGFKAEVEAEPIELPSRDELIRMKEASDVSPTEEQRLLLGREP